LVGQDAAVAERQERLIPAAGFLADVKSISPFRYASVAVRLLGIARATNLASFGLVPQYLGSGTRVMLCAVWSSLPTFHGAAVTGGFVIQPLLNFCGVSICEAGSRAG